MYTSRIISLWRHSIRKTMYSSLSRLNRLQEKVVRPIDKCMRLLQRIYSVRKAVFGNPNVRDIAKGAGKLKKLTFFRARERQVRCPNGMDLPSPRHVHGKPGYTLWHFAENLLYRDKGTLQLHISLRSIGLPEPRASPICGLHKSAAQNQ